MTVKAIVTDKSQIEAKESSEPRMTRTLGRIFERLRTAYADRTARPPIIP